MTILELELVITFTGRLEHAATRKYCIVLSLIHALYKSLHHALSPLSLLSSPVGAGKGFQQFLSLRIQRFLSSVAGDCLPSNPWLQLCLQFLSYLPRLLDLIENTSRNSSSIVE